MSNASLFCPSCNAPISAWDIKSLNFECPSCHSFLSLDFPCGEKYLRIATLLGVTVWFAWRHGWDGGFVIFLLGFYGVPAMLAYFFLVLPLVPRKLRVVASPVSSKYLQLPPISPEEYERKKYSLRPLGITGNSARKKLRSDTPTP
jgi:hypothetical protein